jgi:hypothetical protein
VRRYRGLGARGIAIGWLRGVGGGRATNRLELIVLGPEYVVITPGCAGLGAARMAPHSMVYGPQAALIAECFTPRLGIVTVTGSGGRHGGG